MAPDNLINGRAIAEAIHEETRERIEALKKRGIQPGLVFVRVGEDPASQVYVGMKARTSEKLGLRSETHVLPETASEQELLALIEKLNGDASVHGILVQAPLPRRPIHPMQAIASTGLGQRFVVVAEHRRLGHEREQVND